ncbi:GAP family protein [Mycolicibacterium confluentis]|uniref:Uncharacterized protein n=1 Tax=Mycolicibacterium confluentis TaxID=28047 RepID=A0A7I7XYK9_9MYCO|nr:GAP family protein [Mycolicibacterium confluentis]MCV7318574.1 GAP family protein [Mycolicibacterium confluentis]ORV23776.1 hypothetical protein AWB99_23365 [Mycolicibacterium confluentis]BBZ33882.1 hypothetical protein MCNF_24870 [Mycolicibacterium confluentis]
MWITVLGLALAVNFEPMRLGLITVALSRPKPVLQLLAFLTGSFVMSATAGLIVLFVVRPGLVGALQFDRATVHLTLGVFALALSAVFALRAGPRRTTVDATITTSSSPDADFAKNHGPRAVRAVFSRARGLARGSSPWFSGAMGMGIAIPSIDYLALLVLIATTGGAPVTQAGLLFTFITVANAVVAIPLVSFLIAPESTRIRLEALRLWVAARTRRDVALVLAIAGVVLTVLGISGL